MRCTICESVIDDEAAFCPFCGRAVPDGPVYDDYAYEAFISYRHLERDRKVAMRLQRKLEGMRIPKGVTTPDGRRRLGKLFRDEDELPTDTSLPDQIREALKRSPYLVVVCSPRTNESLWVQREVELFASLHGRERIRIALAEGEPDESFPALLRSRLVPDGSGGVTRVEEEPIAANFRDDHRKTFDTETLRIAATLIGCGFDDLRQRQHARMMRMVALATSATAVLSTAFGSFSYWQQRQIEANYRQAQINESEALAVESQELLAAGDRMEAVQVALAALPESGTSGDRPFVPAAQIALARAVQAYPSDGYWRSCYAVSDVGKAYAVSTEGQQAFVQKDGMVAVASLNTGLTVSTIDVASELSQNAEPDYGVEVSKLAFCGERLLCASVHNHALAVFDARTGKALWKKVDFEADGYWAAGNIAVSPDGTTIALGRLSPSQAGQGERTVTVHLIDAVDGSVRERYRLPLIPSEEGVEELAGVRLAFSPDNRALAASCSGSIWQVNLETGDTHRAATTQSGAFDLSYFDHTIVSITGEGSSASAVLKAAYFDAYDTELTTLWSRKEAPPTYFDDAGIPHTSYAYAVGESAAGNVVYVASNEVKFVDSGTGDDVVVVREPAPLRACALWMGSDLITLDIEGSLRTSLLDEQTGDTIALAQMDVADGEFGSVSLVDDVPYAMVWDARKEAYRVYRMLRLTKDLPGIERIDSLEGMDVDVVCHPQQQDGQPRPNYYLVGSDATGTLCVIGQDSFEPLWTLSYEDLGLGSRVEHAYADDEVLFYTPHDVDGTYTVVSRSLETGEELDRLSFERSESGWLSIEGVGTCPVNGQRALFVVTRGEDYGIHVFAPDTHEELLALGPFDTCPQSLCDVKGTALVAFEQGNRGVLRPFSLADGQPLEDAAVQTLLLPDTYDADSYVSTSGDDSRLVAFCADGQLRCLDTSSWGLVWEQPFANVRTVIFSADGTRLLVQDTSGALFLLSAATGETIRSSSVSLPLISGFEYDEEQPQLLYALCLEMGLTAPKTSFAIISLDEDAFGPITCVNSGLYYTPAQNRLLMHDPLLDDWASVPIASLDELIEQAHTVIEGHELDGTDLHRYRIAH